MKNLKTKIIRAILFVALSGLLCGCENKEIKPRIIEGGNIETTIENKNVVKSENISVGRGDTLYVKYGYGTAMFLVEKVDIKNRVFVGKRCNIYDVNIRDRIVISFSDYLKDKAE